MKKSIYVLLTFLILIASVILSLIATAHDEEPDLIFSHKFHIEEAGADCSACHSNAGTSTKGTDDLLPKEEACMECHDKKTMECTVCHKSGATPVLMPRISNFSVFFNHSKHLAEGSQCNDCHGGIEKSESSADFHLPKMDKCMTCHETPDETDGCYKCHGKNEVILPRDHNELWLSNHSSFSESNGKECASCHNESFCQDCHLNENLFNKPHPPEFILTHSISFMTRESECASCHGGYDFCVDCHTKVNHVVPADHLFNWGKRHQTEAKTKADVCAACHSESERSNSCSCHN